MFNISLPIFKLTFYGQALPCIARISVMGLIYWGMVVPANGLNNRVVKEKLMKYKYLFSLFKVNFDPSRQLLKLFHSVLVKKSIDGSLKNQ